MEKKKKNKILISIVAVVVILLVIGVSYALWIITSEQNGENIVNTACLEISIDDEAGDISIQKAFPIEDSEGETLKPYTFTVTNKCNDLATYQINLESLNKVSVENRLDPNYIKVKLNEVGKTGIKNILGNLSIAETTIDDTYEAHKLMTGYLEPNDVKNFELRLWLDESVTKEDGVMDKQFKSKISVTSTYIEEDDVPPTSSLALSVCNNTITAQATASAYKNKNIEKYEYKLDEGEWQEGQAIQDFEDLDNKIHVIKLRVTDNKGIESEEISQSIEVNYNKELQDMYGKQIQISTCKDGLYKVEHNDLEELGSEWNKTEYRYAGTNPKNYVLFNNEIWRIIGLVNVKTDSGIEQRMKIVRVDGVEGQNKFGNFSWDYGESEYKSNWAESTLKDMLNGIYYESSSGDCYNGNEVASQCDFNTGETYPKGLDTISRELVDSGVIWTLGGWTTPSISTKQFYEKERGTITGNSNNDPIEWSNETDVGGKHNGIGLIYPSDYGYATIGGNSNTREECLANTIYEWYETSDCGRTNDWLNSNVGYLWTVSSHSAYDNRAFGISPYGGVEFDRDYYGRIVWPTLYLKPTVTITSGEGTISEPFNLSV